MSQLYEDIVLRSCRLSTSCCIDPSDIDIECLFKLYHDQGQTTRSCQCLP